VEKGEIRTGIDSGRESFALRPALTPPW
jgi:hypothetical protein